MKKFLLLATAAVLVGGCIKPSPYATTQQRMEICKNAGYDPGKPEMTECLATLVRAGWADAEYQRQAEVKYAQAWKDLHTDPNWCASLAGMAGEDPNQAALDCAMTRHLQQGGNPAIVQQYQRERQIRQQNEQLEQMQETLQQMEQQQRRESWCREHPASGGC